MSVETIFADPFHDSGRPGAAARPPTRRTVGHVPGEAGIWVFIFGDLFAFSLMFGVFLYARAQQESVFDTSRATMSLTFGATNALLLITGSLFVVMGLQACKDDAARRAPRLFALAMACGAAFVINKCFEWNDHLGHGYKPSTNDFYMYYYVFSGIHLLHLLVGLLALAFMLSVSRKPRLATRDIRNLESCASFWHLIDLLWIVLFALLYLVG